jgi:hypothetical protein
MKKVPDALCKDLAHLNAILRAVMLDLVFLVGFALRLLFEPRVVR